MISDVIGAYEAKTHFSELLGRVEQGHEITITRHGVPVALIIPVRNKSSINEKQAAINAIRANAKSLSLGGLSVKDLKGEGRR